MGEGAHGVNGTGADRVGQVSGEIESIRGELGGLVAELDRRRHEAFDLRLQARRHPVLVVATVAVAAIAAGGLLALVVRRRREARRPTVRARRATHALQRLMDHPDRVAAEPSIRNKVATAVVTLVATTLAKRIIDRKVMPPVR